MDGIELQKIHLEVNFNEDGDIKSIGYVCGCGGYEDVTSVERTDLLISAHLTHLKKWHRLTPRVRCDLTIPTGHGELRCVLERHGSNVKHSFEL